MSQRTKLAPHPGVEGRRQGRLGCRLLGWCSAVCVSLGKTTFIWFDSVWLLGPAEKGGPRSPCKRGEVLEVQSLGSRSRQLLGHQGIGSRGHMGGQRWGSGGSPLQSCHLQDCAEWIDWNLYFSYLSGPLCILHGYMPCWLGGTE